MPFAGTVTELLVEGDTVEVGTPIITIDDGVGRRGCRAPSSVQGRRPRPSTRPTPTEEAAPSTADAEEPIEEGKIGGTTSTGRTAVLVGYGVKQTEAKRRPHRGPRAGA